MGPPPSAPSRCSRNPGRNANRTDGGNLALTSITMTAGRKKSRMLPTTKQSKEGIDVDLQQIDGPVPEAVLRKYARDVARGDLGHDGLDFSSSSSSSSSSSAAIR